MATNSLYDASIRQQLYVEGVKNGNHDSLADDEATIIAIIVGLLYAFRVDNIGELSRTQFNKFNAQLRKQLNVVFKKRSNKLYKLLREMMTATFGVTREVFSAIVGTGVKAGSAATQWRAFSTAIVPGAGMTSAEMIGSFLTAAVNHVTRAMTTAWANNASVKDALSSITGTAANNYRDGLFRKLINEFNTLSNTLLQFVVNRVDYHFGKLFFKEYEWVSVLDSRTTDICRGRDGQIYTYGEGPVPPAHYNCRSRIVAVHAVNANVKPRGELAPIPRDETITQWLARQPRDVRQDIVVGNRGGSIDTPAHKRAKPLTVAEYRNKVNKIIT